MDEGSMNNESPMNIPEQKTLLFVRPLKQESFNKRMIIMKKFVKKMGETTFKLPLITNIER